MNIKDISKSLIRSTCAIPVTAEDASKLLLLSFAGFCGMISDMCDINYIKYKISETCGSNTITHAFRYIFDYAAANDYFLRKFVSETIKYNLGAEDWKNIFEYVLKNVFFSAGTKELETPEFVDRLSMAILNPESGSFYDGAAGVGSSLIYAKEYTPSLKIYAQEKNALYHAVLVLRAHIHGIDSTNIMCGDTLTDPKFYFGRRVDRFDCSYIFPPIGSTRKDCSDIIEYDKFERFYRFLGRTMMPEEWLFAMHQYASLNSDGRGITVLPSGCLFNESMYRVRRELVNEGAVECVISLPPNMLSYKKTPLHLLVLKKTLYENSEILFIKADKLFEQYKTDYKKGSEEILKKIVSVYRTGEELPGISKRVKRDMLEGAILLPSRYVQDTVKLRGIGDIAVNEPHDGGDWSKLKYTGEFYRGINISTAKKNGSPVTRKIINYSDVQEGRLLTDGIQSHELGNAANFEKSTVRTGDLLISCKGTAIKICVVPENCGEILLSANFIGIHIDNSRYNPYFLQRYLESPVGQSMLLRRQVGTSILTLAARDLEEIPVPRIEYDKQTEYVNKLIYEETRIREEISALYTRSDKAKWDFYMQIGLGEIMTKEENDYAD